MSHWSEKVVELLSADTSDLRELAVMAGRDPKEFYRGVDPKKLDLMGQDLASIGLASPIIDVIGKLNKAQVKEERLAIVLDYIFQNRSDPLDIFWIYPQDRSGWATGVLEILKEVLTQEGQLSELDNVTLLHITKQKLGNKMSRDRANFIFYMAKYLSKYPEPKRYLQQMWSRTTSSIYDQYEKEINYYLYGANKPEEDSDRIF